MARNGTLWIPSAKQKKIVQLMVDFDDNRKLKEKLEEAKVPKRTFYNWMGDQRFLNYLQSQINLYTDAEIPTAWKQLIKNMRRGDTQSIKIFMEMKGKYTQKMEVSGKDGGPIEVASRPDLSKLSEEELRLLAELIEKSSDTG